MQALAGSLPISRIMSTRFALCTQSTRARIQLRVPDFFLFPHLFCPLHFQHTPPHQLQARQNPPFPVSLLFPCSPPRQPAGPISHLPPLLQRNPACALLHAQVLPHRCQRHRCMHSTACKGAASCGALFTPPRRLQKTQNQQEQLREVQDEQLSTKQQALPFPLSPSHASTHVLSDPQCPRF